MRFVLLFLVVVVACNSDPGFVQAFPGLEYKIISDQQADMARPGETLKMHIRQVYNDSTLSDTRDSLPYYQVLDSAAVSPESLSIFLQLRKGDSVVFKALSDSAFKSKFPPFAKKGEFLYTHLKIIDVLGVKEDFRDDMKREYGRLKK